MSAESLGLNSGSVTIVPSDVRWTGLFDEAAREIATVLGPAILALRANPTLAAEYGALKLRLAEQFPRDRQAYLEGKTTFVARVLAESETPGSRLP